MSSAKNVKLQNFIKFNYEAKAVVIVENGLSDIISYNGYISLQKFKRRITNLSTKALFSHIDYLTSIQGDPLLYLSCIKHAVAEAMINIQQFEEYTYHKKVRVFDKNDRELPFPELPLSLKKKIGAFSAIQQNSLLNFLKNINDKKSNSEYSNLTWLGTKTDLVELGNALYESGTIGSKNGTITKKYFMEMFSSFMNVDIGSTHKTLNKATLRNNPSQFIDKLKMSFNNYIERKIQS